ncbi:leucine-rich repeat-containing protein 34-like [Rhopilema esculentum]|uniref:leucine-rich repeat-containing protein 34-like n=1 Tax=Rhopilema esculentum TaxID=499914 RepID=UPI0031CFB130|eukprot:gene6742-12305_t
MSDPRSTKEDYLKVVTELKKDVNKEIVLMLKSAEDEHMTEPIYDFKLKLNGNKKNERNEMYRKRLVDEDVDILFQTLKSNSFVIGLDLGYNNIGDTGAEILSKLLQETLVLQSLILSYNDIGPEGACALAKGVQVNETLRVLKLNGNKIGNKGGLALAGALQVNTVLEDIDLAETDMKNETVIAYATVFCHNGAMKYVNLDRPLYTSKQEETTVHLANMLKVNSHLRELHLSKHDIRNFGAERLAENLAFNVSLTHLDLRANRISRDGAYCLAKLLKENTPLEHLNLAYNRIEDHGAVYLSEALATANSNLTTLVVRGNTINGRGLCALAKALESNQTLKRIYIWGNNMERDACQAFADLLAGVVPRINASDADVEAYFVDDAPYLAEVDCPY